MRIGVPLEQPGQPLVAATPDTVTKLIKLGYKVTVESGAGGEASYPDLPVRSCRSEDCAA